MNMLLKKDANTRRQYVYNYLYENIIDLTYKPGTSLSENEIAAQLGVSRTPVREALIQLSKEDLVEIIPQIGTFVSLIDPNLVEESRFMRETLEIGVIKLAAENITEKTLLQLENSIKMQQIVIGDSDYKEFLHQDDAFHQLIFQSLDKERTWQTIDQMNAQFKRVRILRLLTTGRSRWEDILHEHEKIVLCLRNKDVQLAQSTMKDHLTKGIVHMDELKELHPDYFKKI
ncbi:GntR family transcriptional regulator [Paenisporosarcina macmurdoensis]|uniref:GntR family transcriptional regulator n=1 Tax=Paenisporosarcina macmurdoensis TaxID=212659 RepID=A0ABW1L3E7_9BACL